MSRCLENVPKLALPVLAMVLKDRCERAAMVSFSAALYAPGAGDWLRLAGPLRTVEELKPGRRGLIDAASLLEMEL